MSRKKSESEREKLEILKDFSKNDLFELFEWMSSLCKVDCRFRHFQRVHAAWKQFWQEVARSMTKSATGFNPPQGSEGQKSPLIRRQNLYRIGSIFRYSRSKFRRLRCGKEVPIIRITGLWLEDYGFTIRRKFEVYPAKNQLILRLVSVVDPSGLPESFPSADPSSEATVIQNV